MKKPFVIAIAGCSGSGKSTFSQMLLEEFKDYKVELLPTDKYFNRPLPKMISPLSNLEYDDYNCPESLNFEKSLEEFIIDRNREGENLKKDLLLQLQKIQQASEVFTEWKPKMECAFKENILKKFNELLGDKVDEQRVMTEVASLMVKYTINEEIVRLKSHIKAIYNEIENNETPGKRLDFICQEMNREINTIGSKNQFIEIAEQVINAKDALENIREQSKNIE